MEWGRRAVSRDQDSPPAPLPEPQSPRYQPSPVRPHSVSAAGEPEASNPLAPLYNEGTEAQGNAVTCPKSHEENTTSFTSF